MHLSPPISLRNWIQARTSWSRAFFCLSVWFGGDELFISLRSAGRACRRFLVRCEVSRCWPSEGFCPYAVGIRAGRLRNASLSSFRFTQCLPALLRSPPFRPHPSAPTRLAWPCAPPPLTTSAAAAAGLWMRSRNGSSWTRISAKWCGSASWPKAIPAVITEPRGRR